MKNNDTSLFPIYAAAITSSPLVILPSYVDVTIALCHASVAQAGLMAALCLLGMLIAQLAPLPPGEAMSSRMIRYGMVLFALSALGLGASHSISLSAIFMLLNGLASGVATAGASRSFCTRPDIRRHFAFMQIGQNLTGVADFLLYPTLAAHHGEAWMFYGLALLMVPVLAWQPQAGAEPILTAKAARPEKVAHVRIFGLRPHVLILCLSVLLDYTGNSIAWAYITQIGRQHGFTESAISHAMLLSMAGGLIAGLVVSRVSRWTGRMGGILSGLLILALCDGALMASQFPLYCVAAFLISFEVVFVYPLYMDVLAENQDNGRSVVVGNAQIALGTMAGPALSAWMLHGTDFTPVLMVSASIMILSAASTCLSFGIRRRV